MENLPILIIAAIIASIVLIAFLFSKKAMVKRKLKKAIAKPISDVRDGEFVKIIGKVTLVGDALKAPLSGRDCAYYYVHVEKKVSSGKSSHWSTIIEEEVGGSYVINDGTNNAFINSRQIKSYLVEDRKYYSGVWDDASEVLENYLRKHDQHSEGMLGFNKKIRYKEGILEPQEMIAVFGKAQWKEADELKLPDSFGKILSLYSTENVPVYLSDDPDVLKNKKRERYSKNYERH
ncbi:MAG: hypothetical protein JEZ09_03580 [Salinivirgaceae bacterium]|nr:hypothetical protein [Salinivirgaceae bacterium]